VTDEGVKIGTPYLSGVTVKGEVQGTGRGEKIIVYKYKPKKATAKARPSPGVHGDDDHVDRQVGRQVGRDPRTA